MKDGAMNFEKEAIEEACNGHYEGAMHYDCRVCEADCKLRKGGAKSSEIIAGMCFLGMISIIVVVVVGKLAMVMLKAIGI